MAKKSEQTTIRITPDDKEALEKYGGSATEIWELGMSCWIGKVLPSKLKDKADAALEMSKFYQNLLLQCNNKIGVGDDRTMALEDLHQWFVKAHDPRQIGGREQEAIRAIIKKRGYKGISLDDAITYIESKIGSDV